MSLPDGNWADPAMPDRELRAIRTRAETEAQSLLFGLAYYAHAQAASARYGPTYDRQRARLAELEAQRAQTFAVWQRARATARDAHARARATNDRSEQIAQEQVYTDASQQSVELAQRLNTLDKNLESLRLEVQHAAAFLSALRAVERPVLPSWFLDAVRVAIRGTGPLRL